MTTSLILDDKYSMIVTKVFVANTAAYIFVRYIYLFVGVVAKISFNNVCYNENLVGG